MNGHELYPYGDHFECSCGDFVRWPSEDVEEEWAEHVNESWYPGDFNVEGQPEFNGAFA